MGLMLAYKKFPDKYFDWWITNEFPRQEIGKHQIWYKEEYNNNGKLTYYEASDGYWEIMEYDADGDEIYWEDSDGEIIDNRR